MSYGAKTQGDICLKFVTNFSPSHYLNKHWITGNWALRNKAMWHFIQIWTVFFRPMNFQLSLAKYNQICAGHSEESKWNRDNALSESRTWKETYNDAHFSKANIRQAIKIDNIHECSIQNTGDVIFGIALFQHWRISTLIFSWLIRIQEDIQLTPLFNDLTLNNG